MLPGARPSSIPPAAPVRPPTVRVTVVTALVSRITETRRAGVLPTEQGGHVDFVDELSAPNDDRGLRRGSSMPRAMQAALLAGAALLVSAAPSCVAEPRALPAGPSTFGWVEWVRVEPGSTRVKAKLDTGATTSSIDARHQEVFERDGKRWVRFTIEDRDGREVPLERRIERFVKIRRPDDEFDRRPVVTLDLCLGGSRRSVEVSLADRKGFVYPVLLGRNFLKHVAVVDSAQTFTAEPACAGQVAAGRE